jgi:hypothetical protein
MLFMIKKYFANHSGNILINNLNKFSIKLKIQLLEYIQNYKSDKKEIIQWIKLLMSLFKKHILMLNNN